MTAGNPLFGRQYQVLVTNGGATALDVSALKCTFEIEKKAIQAINYADVTIYNLNESDQQAVIQEGMRVIVQAGYTNGAYGKIYDGEVFQPLFDRENVTDYKLTLHCIDGDSSMHGNFVSYCASRGYDQRTVLSAIAAHSRNPIPMGTITPGLKTTKAPRGKTVFGDPRDVFRKVSQDNNANFYMNDGQLEVMKITDVPQGQAVVISPATGLVGTPQQIDYGFSFRCLLNPNIKITNPCMMVKIDNSSIRQEKIIQGQPVSMLDADMVGIVIGVRYIGDTRGNDWYCDVTCLNRGGMVPLGLTSSQLPEIVRNSMEYSS
jgi:hypothetical protein